MVSTEAMEKRSIKGTLSVFRVFFEEIFGEVWFDAFVEVVVDEADRGGAAGGEAFGEFDGPCSAGGDGDGVVVAVEG